MLRTMPGVFLSQAVEEKQKSEHIIRISYDKEGDSFILNNGL